MNLYKILVTHLVTKNKYNEIRGYVIADSDQEIFDYLCTEPKINGVYCFNSWNEEDYCSECEDDERLKLDCEECISLEEKKLQILQNKGDIEEDYSSNDLYYGKTYYDWELVGEDISSTDKQVLENLGIATYLGEGQDG